jgi:hypothetical protein
VTAVGTLAIPVEELPALRKAPGPSGADGPAIPGSLLRHADDHTVLALAAVLRARSSRREQAGDGGERDADWGILVAPRYPGRLAVTPHLERFRRQGPGTVSPLIIPTMSLHAAAGSVSLALGLHGPSYGVGGGPGHLGQLLLAGLAALGRDPSVPGVWVVATGWDPEPIPDLKGKPLNAATGHAVALGLEPAATDADAEAGAFGLRLEARPGATGAPVPEGDEPGLLAGLLAWLEGPREADWSLVVPGGLAVGLGHASAVATAPGDPSRCGGRHVRS